MVGIFLYLVWDVEAIKPFFAFVAVAFWSHCLTDNTASRLVVEIKIDERLCGIYIFCLRIKPQINVKLAPGKPIEQELVDVEVAILVRWDSVADNLILIFLIVVSIFMCRGIVILTLTIESVVISSFQMTSVIYFEH